MKKFILFFLVSSLLSTSFAQEEGASEEETAATTEESAEATPAPTSTVKAKKVTSRETWGVNVAALQWNEKLKLQQGLTSESDNANYNGMIVTIQKEVTYYRWGWNFGAFIGAGRANGGGDNSLDYSEGKVAFTVYGVSPRAFYRFSGRINAGISVLAFMKNADWPAASGQTIDSGRNMNVMPMADLNIRLFQKWDFYQGLGPLAEGSTMWKVGATYRF